MHVERNGMRRQSPRRRRGKKYNLDSADIKRMETCYLRRRLFPNSENVPPRRL